ncbi:MAG: hypothetical protein FWG12_02285 [Holophagaceae bacterium]|nr:hypothetical protein [Holophagaceae bacterium]
MPRWTNRKSWKSLLLPLAILAHSPIAQAQDSTQDSSGSLSFSSSRINYHWDRIIPLDFSVDDLQVKTIFFNKREINKGFLKGAQFGTRAQVEVVNLSNTSRNVGFAVAVFDERDNLLGVATGGNRLLAVKSGKTAKFDLNFWQVTERLQRGAYFVLSVELVK